MDQHQIASKHLDPAYVHTQLALFQALQNLRFCAGEACAQEMGPVPDPA